MVAGDIDVAYSTSMNNKRGRVSNKEKSTIGNRGRGGGENKLSKEQFREALSFIAVKKYKNNEEDIWNEALDEGVSTLLQKVYLTRLIQTSLKPWGITKGVLKEDGPATAGEIRLFMNQHFILLPLLNCTSGA